MLLYALIILFNFLEPFQRLTHKKVQDKIYLQYRYEKKRSCSIAFSFYCIPRCVPFYIYILFANARKL